MAVAAAGLPGPASVLSRTFECWKRSTSAHWSNAGWKPGGLTRCAFHLGEAGAPLAGETIYDRPMHGGPPRTHPAPLGWPCTPPRSASFTRLRGGENWESPLPDDLQAVLDRLRHKALDRTHQGHVFVTMPFAIRIAPRTKPMTATAAIKTSRIATAVRRLHPLDFIQRKSGRLTGDGLSPAQQAAASIRRFIRHQIQ